MSTSPTATLVAAVGVLVVGGGALFLVTRLAGGPRPSSEPPVAQPATPPAPKPPAITPPPPLTFVDKDNEKRLEPLEASLTSIKAALTKSDFASGRTLCRAASKDLTALQAEPHPRVRAAVDGTKRACECDLPAATLSAALDAIAKSPGTKKSACKDAVRYVDELRANKYGDDAAVAAVLARFGAVCAT